MSYSETVVVLSTVKSGLKKDEIPRSVIVQSSHGVANSQMSDLELFWVCRVGWVTD